ncbi:hypothetical protein SAMN02799630_01196 [Paenibacillus sp. UNCCL117]|uniref:hypothetical protein n=1 Tax=unclassified Paenibacillus TaxID=185978 RepID=UPI00087E32F8|nr:MULTISPECIES: hypothetical protein [unclassified Paenibacillus]SDC69140.1 hypothetical protein SAMN04488602_103174 [Paenibacillus sp. cl123]SFW23824.1 hypothetical protein SAMN02799630_01196 [Paenibacillus sp. UNCCL117]
MNNTNTVITPEVFSTFLDYQDVTLIKAEINDIILDAHDCNKTTKEMVAVRLLVLLHKINSLEKIMFDKMQKASQS